MPHMQKTSYHPIEDFTFIMGLSGYLFDLAVPADSPFETFDDYIDAAKQNPALARSTTARPALGLHRIC